MRKIFAAAFLLAVARTASADDGDPERLNQWPHWRGPLGNGVAPRSDPPVEWSESRNLRWKLELPGSGSATPVVWGEKLFVLTAIDTGKKPDAAPEPAPAPPPPGSQGMSTSAPTTIHQFVVLCLDRESGRTIWRRTAVEAVPHEGHHRSHGFASASPATDGKRLIASFGSRGIFCFDLDGHLQWKRELGRMKIKVGFGEGISPVLHGDSVLVNWDHEGGSFIVRLDASTGEEKWRQARDEGTTWTTPLVVDGAGTAQVVVNGTKRTRSYDLATGKLLWECGGQVMNPIAMPVAEDGTVYCMSGYKGYAVVAIRLDSKGDVTGQPRQVPWTRSDAAPYVASPVLSDGLLYFTKERQGILMCVDAKTGDLKYGPERLPEIETLYSSLMAAAGKLYIAGREGTVLVLKQGPVFEVLARNRLDEGIDASPVAVGKQLYLRGAKHLYCIEAK
jgi:outer membrane protein assembly factor BamB